MPSPIVDWSADWWTWAVGVLFSIMSGVATGSYFVGSTKKDIDTLKVRMDEHAAARIEQKKELRDVVHELRNEMHKISAGAAKTSDAQRIEAHLVRQDEKIENRFNQVVALIVNGRARTNGTPAG